MNKMKKITLWALLAIVLCCCNNKQNNCCDCKTLTESIPSFEKKFPEKKVSLEIDRPKGKGKTFEMTFSSMEEAEYKIVECVLDENKIPCMGGYGYCDLLQQVIRSDESSMDYPFDALIDESSFTVVDSDDGQVRCYGWHHLDGTSNMNPELMVQYRGKDGNVYVVDCEDFENGDYMPEDKYNIYPKEIYRIQGGDETYTIVWGIYGSSMAEELSNYGLIALKLDEKGVSPVMLFQDDELKESLDVDYCLYSYDEEQFELIRFDEDELSFSFPGYNLKYVWNGEAFVLHRRDEDEALQLILTSIANGDKETFADLVRYPLIRDYPLRDIKNKKEMMKYFDFLFDKDFRKTIGSLSFNDWHLMGWRGFMVLSGELWEDGGELVCVNYSSPAEQRLRDSLIKAELEALHPSLQGNWEPVDRLGLLDEEFDFARIDKSTECDTLYRLSLFAKNAKIDDKPVVCLMGDIQYEGNMGDGHLCFQSQDTMAFYVFGNTEEDCVPQRKLDLFLWVDRNILYKGCYYQIDYSF